jgi:lipoprotein signal peptidase
MEKLSGWMVRYVPLILSLFIVIGDRITKLHIQQKFTSLDVVTLIPGWLRIVHTKTQGRPLACSRTATLSCAASS